MAQTGGTTGIGKQHPVYKGEIYEVDGRGLVRRHGPDKTLPARKNGAASKIIAIYSEILDGGGSPASRLQVMDEKDVKRAIREIKAKGKRPTERSLKYAAKAAAAIAAESRVSGSSAPPAGPAFKNRPLGRIKLFIWLPATALISQLLAVAATGIDGWIGVAAVATYWLGWLAHLAAAFRAFGWLLDISYEIRQTKAVERNVPDPKSFIAALAVIAAGATADIAFNGDVEPAARFLSIVLLATGGIMWLLSVGHFFKCVARLAGLPGRTGFMLALPFAVAPMAGHVSMLYLQRRLNPPDENGSS